MTGELESKEESVIQTDQMSHATIDVIFSATARVDGDSGDGDAIGGKDKGSLEGENEQVAEANKGLCRRE